MGMAKEIYVRVDQDSDGQTFLDASERLEEVVADDGALSVVGHYKLVGTRKYRKLAQVVGE